MRAIDRERMRMAYPAEYNAGRSFAARRHVSLTNLQILREAWKTLRSRPANFEQRMRPVRKAFYLGILDGHQQNINLYIRVQRGRLTGRM